MKLSIEKGEIVIEDVWEKPIIIPLQLFPFTGQLEVFYYGNTEEYEDMQIKNIFDSICFNTLVDRYTSRDLLVEALEDANFPKERYKTYTGWLFIGETLPIHHVFIVVDSKHILDLYTDRGFGEYATCGKVNPMFVYIGSTEKPKVGRILLRKLTQEYYEQQEEEHNNEK